MKKILIAFCVAFTVIVLLTSFSPVFHRGNDCSGGMRMFSADEIEVNNQRYIVVTTANGGIAICKE